jgi:hypothetical protein
VRIWIVAAALAATLTTSAPGMAQSSGAGTHGRADKFDPVLLQGPPAAVEFAKIAGLDQGQQERYADLQQRFMVSTQPQRDSLKAISSAAREAFQGGDRAKARAQRPTMRNLRNGLVERQKQFDESVKQLLRSEQWQKYEQWRENERERVKKEWRERRGHPA